MAEAQTTTYVCAKHGAMSGAVIIALTGQRINYNTCPLCRRWSPLKVVRSNG